MALRDEEHLIVQWLSQYGPMTRGMIGKLLHYKPGAMVSRIIGGLVRYRKITMIEDHKYYAIDKYCTLIPKMHDAIYVLMQFAEAIEPTAHQLADKPAQIRFVKGNSVYEIVVVDRNEEHLTHFLTTKKDTIYLIVVPDMDFAETLWLPDCPCIFVTLDYDNGTYYGDPEVNFYSA